MSRLVQQSCVFASPLHHVFAAPPISLERHPFSASACLVTHNMKAAHQGLLDPAPAVTAEQGLS